MSDSARLSRTVLPVSYDLLVDTDTDMAGFTGEVGIELEVMERTSTIVLHAKDLDVTLGSLTQRGGQIDAELTVDAATERLIIQAASPLAVGPARLVLRFGGEV